MLYLAETVVIGGNLIWILVVVVLIFAAIWLFKRI